MSEPDRYEPVINGAAMRQAKAGAYVLFTDYETAARDNDGLRAELNFARDDIRELATVRDELSALLDELRIAVMEMHHDNVKGDFELPPLARIDLDACVAKCSDERIPRAALAKQEGKGHA